MRAIGVTAYTVKRVGQGFGLLIILILLAGFVCNQVANAKLKAVLVTMEKEGIPTTWESYKTQFLDGHIGFSDRSNLVVALQGMAALPKLSDERRKVLPIEGSVKLPEPNQPIPVEMMIAASERLKETTSAVAILRQIASLRPPWASAPITNDAGRCFALPTIRQAVRLQVMSAIYNAEKGNTDLAIDAISGGLMVGSVPHNGSVMIDELVRLACEDVSIMSLEYVLCKTSPSPEQLNRIEEFLLPYSDIRSGMIGEVVWIRAMGTSLMNDLYELDSSHRWMRRPLVLSGWASTVEARQMNLLRQIIGKWGCSWGEISAFAKSKEPEERKFVFVTDMYADMYADIYLGIKRKELRSHGIRDCARIAVAIKKYSQAFGALPESLDSLSPKFIENVPPEPFFGKPFSYVRDGNKGVISFHVPDDERAAVFRVYAQ